MCQFLRLGGPFCLVTHSIITSKKFHKYLSALANFFVGFHEERLFDYDQKPGVYFRYVDDTYTIFKTEAECDAFLKHLNNLHLALQFTFEKEENDSLPFLVVLVEKSNTGFLTSVYRKPTFTGQYIRWNSFCPKQRKVNLVKTLVHRALMICSKSKLHAELEKLKTIFLDNDYPENVYNDDMFRIIGRARSSFHLAVLESIYIQTKKPPLCRQKEFVFSLGLQW